MGRLHTLAELDVGLAGLAVSSPDWDRLWQLPQHDCGKS